MIVLFRQEKLKKLTDSKSELARKYGDRQATIILVRLNALRAAENLEEIRFSVGCRCHELKADRAGQLSVDLVHPHRLIFEPANEPIPYKSDGGLDWKLVTEIRILEVVDTHG